MSNGGYAAVGVFRKHLSEKTEKSKYPTIVKTAEDIEAEENEKANRMEEDSSSEDEAPQVAVSAPKPKNYTIADIMTLDKSLQITKKQKKTDQAAPEVKSKAIKKKKHAKKSQKIVKFWYTPAFAN